MNKNSEFIVNRYIVGKGESVNRNISQKMERNLQPEVVRVQAAKESIDGMDYISPSEAKRLLYEIEALVSSLDKWTN